MHCRYTEIIAKNQELVLLYCLPTVKSTYRIVFSLYMQSVPSVVHFENEKVSLSCNHFFLEVVIY